MLPKRFHVFISHNSKDKAKITKLVQGLQRDGFEVWFDIDDIVAGENWEKQVLKELNDSKVCVIFFSEEGWGPHHLAEAKMAQTISEIKIVPVFLPGAPDNKSLNQIFFEQSGLSAKTTYLDFRSQFNIQNALTLLQKAILGEGKGLDWSVKLERDARNWENKRQSTYSGRLLKDAQEWGKKNPSEVSEKGWAFINASLAAQSARLRQIIIGLIITISCITCLALYAFIQRNIAVSNENARATAQALSEIEANARATAQANAENQTRVAIANELSAYSNASLRDFPQRSLLLAIEALRTNKNYGEEPQLSAQQAMRDALVNYQGTGIGKHRFSVNKSAVSPDGQWYATVSNDGQTFLWKLQTENLLEAFITLSAHTRGITSLSFSPDSRWLITGGNDGAIISWNLVDESIENSATVLLQDDRCDGNLGNAPPLAPITSDDQGYVYCYVSHLGFAPNGKWLIADYGTSQGETLASWEYSNEEFSTQPRIFTSIGSSEPQPGLEPIYYYNWVKAFAFNSESNWLAVSYGYGGIEVWKIDNEISNYVFLKDYLITDLVFSNKVMFASTESGDLLYWEIKGTGIDAEPIKLFGKENQGGFKLLISEDQKWLVGISGVDIFVWDLQDLAKSPQTIIGSHEKVITSAEILPNNQWLITGSDDHIIKVWPLSEKLENSLYILRGHDASITTLTSTSDSKWLFSGDQNGSVHFWDLSAPNQFLSTRNPSVLIAGNDYLTTVAMNSVNSWLVAGGFSGKTYFWKLDSDGYRKVEELYGSVYELRFSPDNRWVVSASADGSVSIWDSQSIQNPPETIFTDREVPFEISPNGKWIAVVDTDNSVNVYQLGGTYDTPIAKIRNSDLVSSLAWSPDSNLLAFICQDQTLQIWNTKDLPRVEQIDFISPIFDAIEAKAKFSPDGNWLVFSDREGLFIWSIENGNLSGKAISLSDHPTPATKLSISDDGRWLVSASGPKALDFLYEKDLTVRIWDLYSNNPSQSVIELNSLQDDILDATISPNGKWIAAASKDNKIYLWDMNTININNSPQIFDYHTDWVNDLEFSADSNFLLSASADGTVRIWELDFEKMISEACEIVGRNLSKKEWDEYFPNEIYRTTCSQWIAEE